MGTYVYLPELTTAQLREAATWLEAIDAPTASLQADTGGYLHVTAGEDRMVFRPDGNAP
jgi:hypothetical protein